MKIPGAMVPELLRHLGRKPATVPYPFQRLELPAGFRGKPVVETEKCIGCKMCERDCPAEACVMVEVGPKAFRPSFYYDRCTFCGQCEESCTRGAIIMTAEFELAGTDRAGLFNPAPAAPPKPAPKPVAEPSPDAPPAQA
jgi:formate hydrogenlyase subunit 6/NADH:ubiquinone oxidoreductase subunit I